MLKPKETSNLTPYHARVGTRHKTGHPQLGMISSNQFGVESACVHDSGSKSELRFLLRSKNLPPNNTPPTARRTKSPWPINGAGTGTVLVSKTSGNPLDD